MLAKADVTDDGFVYDSYPDFNYVFVTGYNGDATSLVFPEFGDGVTVYVNDDFVNSVANANVITEVDFSNVDEVGSGAFVVKTTKKPTPSGLVTVKTGFLSLTKVVLGEKAPEFYEGAFSGVTITELAFSGNTASNVSEFASTVTTVDLSSVTTIGDGAFQGFAQLNTIKNFEGVTSIGSFAFSGCTGLTNIDLSNVTSIGESAFRGCTGLSSVDLSSVTTIGASAFQDCGNILTGEGLQNVFWPENLTEFPAKVFYGCAVLKSVTNLENAIVIGDFAFYNCSSLNGTKEFSSALRSVGKDAFMGTNLTTVVVKSNPLLSENAFPAAVALNLEIEDKMAFSDDNENTFDKITYKREFTSGKFASLILPFVPEQIDQFDVYKLRENKENSLVFQVVNEFVPGTPYMVKVKEGYEDVEELTATDATIKKSVCENRVEAGDWKMIGQYERIELKAKEGEAIGVKYYYYKSADNGFYYSTGTLGVSPFRTYIEAPLSSSAQVRMMVRGFGGVETDIDVVELEDVLIPTVDAYYDLNGNPVQVPVEGKVYIVNGKKMIF